MSHRALDIASRISKGHAARKHLDKFKELGVETPEQYRQHIAKTLKDPATKAATVFASGQTWRKADIFYNVDSNTLIVVPANAEHEPTAHRPMKGDRPAGARAFLEKIEEAERIQGHQIEVFNGMQALEQTKLRGHVTADFAKAVGKHKPQV